MNKLGIIIKLSVKIWLKTAAVSLIMLSLTTCQKEPDQKNKHVAVTGVTLNESSLTLAIGNSHTLIATVLPANATYKRVTWESSNTNVAEVDANGKVFAKSEGVAEIFVTTTDGKKQANCKFTVTTRSKDMYAYPVPTGTPNQPTSFIVTANNQEVGVYADDTRWSGIRANFAYFNLRKGFDVEVKISPLFNFAKVTVLPESLGIVPVREGYQLSFTVNQPNLKITLVFDDNCQGNTLHLFTNPIDDNEPTESSENLIYFGPGYHPIEPAETEKITIKSGQTLYIAPGAVVDGRIEMPAAKNAHIRGSGVLINSLKRSFQTLSLIAINCENVTLEGVIFSTYMAFNWNIAFYFSNNITIQNLKVVSPRYTSTDGINFINSRNSTVTNCFVRACDDVISLKGVDPSLPIENIRVENCILWNDSWNCVDIGCETEATYYKNITFKNIDVLHHYPYEGRSKASVMSIICLQGTYFEDITWEDIRVNRCARLISMTFPDELEPNFYPGNQTLPGGIKNVVFRNITSNATNITSSDNEILLAGYVANGANLEKKIENILFDNVVINGVKVTADYDRLKVSGPVSGLEFR